MEIRGIHGAPGERPAPRFLVESVGSGVGCELALDAEESAHAARVLRLRVGRRARVFDGRGAEFLAEVTAVHPRKTTCRLLAPIAPVSEAPLEVVLAFGLAKRAATDLIVQKAVELGARRLRPFVCERSVVARGEKGPDARLTRWRRIARDATKQCGRAWLCDIEDAVDWASMLSAAPPDAARVLCWEAAGDRQRLSEALSPEVLDGASGLWLAVGPEGGLTSEEVALAERSGWRVASLGPRVLRAETAAIAALTVAGVAMGQM